MAILVLLALTNNVLKQTSKSLDHLFNNKNIDINNVGQYLPSKSGNFFGNFSENQFAIYEKPSSLLQLEPLSSLDVLGKEINIDQVDSGRYTALPKQLHFWNIEFEKNNKLRDSFTL